MERPWLILGRVVLPVHVPEHDDDLHVDAEDHGVVVDPEADAQAQEEEHAAVGEDEDHVVAVDAEAEAEEQAPQHAAVAEAEEDAQAQHAAVAEAEEDAQADAVENGNDAVGEAAQDEEEDAQAQEDEEFAELDVAEELELAPAYAAMMARIQLEDSVVNVNTDAAESEQAHAAMVGFYLLPDCEIRVMRPPRVSSIIARTQCHPDPARPDMYPYVIAAGRFCILVHFAVAPSHGTNFAHGPERSHLVVLRHFVRDLAVIGIVACAVPVPERPIDDFLHVPALRSIESVGLVCNQETGHYQIAELIVTTGAPQSVVVHTRSDTGIWEENNLVNPLLPVNCLRDWVPHGTLAINSTVLWFDLSWGIISCDLAQPPELQVLNFRSLPPGRVLHAGAGVPDLHCRRCIAVSENLVRYVEIILNTDQAATVNMWHRDVEGNPPWRWETNYSVSFEDIWEHESYAETELPRNPPMLVGVSPVDCNVVYFSLNQRLFGVNVPEHTVVECQQYEPLHRPGPPDEPVTSRYFITWNLDADLAPNVGHQPDDRSDHADSTGSGPADEGEIDYSCNGDSNGSGPSEEEEID